MDWTRRLDALRGLLADKAGARGASLDEQLRRARRRIPRRLRGDARTLLRAETLARHPRFARLVDPRDVRRAEARLSRHLGTLDLGRERRDRALNLLAAVGLAVLATGALVVWALWSRGYV